MSLSGEVFTISGTTYILYSNLMNIAVGLFNKDDLECSHCGYISSLTVAVLTLRQPVQTVSSSTTWRRCGASALASLATLVPARLTSL